MTDYYIQCSTCYEMVSPMTRATFESFQGISTSREDKVAVCEKCGNVEFIVGYEDE